MNLLVKSGAEFSLGRTHRYTLWREWDEKKPTCTFIMLNPSTADANANDPTVERCQRRAEKMGYGRLEVRNIFGYRSTNPKHLYTTVNPIGTDNDAVILESCSRSNLIICGWGGHGRYMQRGQKVVAMLRNAGHQLHCLGMTACGNPKHPLYLAYNVQPEEMP